MLLLSKHFDVNNLTSEPPHEKTNNRICENKDADQLRGNREADQRLCFRYTDSTIPLLAKSKISSFYQSPVLVQLGLCRTYSKTTLLVFPRDDSYSVTMFKNFPVDLLFGGFQSHYSLTFDNNMLYPIILGTTVYSDIKSRRQFSCSQRQTALLCFQDSYFFSHSLDCLLPFPNNPFLC